LLTPPDFRLIYRKSMRGLRYALTWVWLGLASAQSIVTVAGLPYSHRDAVDGKPALSAPLNDVYGLLFDKLTGRLLIHDVGTLFRRLPIPQDTVGPEAECHLCSNDSL
jgi:hypothetical protein